MRRFRVEPQGLAVPSLSTVQFLRVVRFWENCRDRFSSVLFILSSNFRNPRANRWVTGGARPSWLCASFHGNLRSGRSESQRFAGRMPALPGSAGFLFVRGPGEKNGCDPPPRMGIMGRRAVGPGRGAGASLLNSGGPWPRIELYNYDCSKPAVVSRRFFA